MIGVVKIGEQSGMQVTLSVKIILPIILNISLLLLGVQLVLLLRLYLKSILIVALPMSIEKKEWDFLV